ncbi:MAG: trigger factor [Gammaproteobacteria bacterium]|nr:trigger factor [Gammaproteobacteria bacterium]MDH3374863.1 trigger factor [Gammaproteobacteria bacterium]MDH3410170.1 trigger factor [Gammaproteobacteria bacterium]
MQVTVESTGKLERRMRVELPAERIEREVDTRLKSVGRTAKLKGFRPGKVPPKVVKQRYGKQIREEVLSELMQKSYSDAVMQENLHPVGGPKIKPETTDGGKSFAYVATFEIMPEIELKDLDKLEFEKPDVTIDDNDLDDMILKLRKQKATWNEVERASGEGDRVIVDFTGTLKGEEFKGGKGTEVPVILGQGQMLPDFEKALFGVKAGDEKSFKVKFPKDYHAEDLAGKKVDFAIKTHRVEEESLPPVDDSLAEAFDVKEGGIDQFMKDVKDNMEREADAKVKSELREQIMNALLEANRFDIPQTLKRQEMHTLQHDAMRRLGVEDHSQAPPIENFAEMAERRVRLSLLVTQLIADQRLTVDASKVRERIEEMCAGYENSDEMVDMYVNNAEIVRQIEPLVLEQQAFDWILENGKTTTKKVAFTEYMR